MLHYAEYRVSNASKFTRELSAELSGIVEEASDAIAKTGLFGWNVVTTATPVQTGRAKGSWLLSVDEAPEWTLPRVPGTYRVYDDPIQPNVSFDLKRNQAIVISSNVEYIEELEEGGPNRTAFAMVASATPKINNDLKRRLKKIK